MKNHLKFKCGRCGKTGVLGQHFCNSRDVEKYQAKINYDPDADLGYESTGELRRPLRISEHLRSLGTVIGIVLMTILLYQLLGPFAIAAGLALAILTLMAKYRGKLSSLFSNHFPELVALCRGDKFLAERLINAELSRQAGITRNQAINAAISRLLADRMR